jgi:hypothetical protein
MDKKRIVRWFVDWTHGWNVEFHQAIEAKVQAEYSRVYSNPEGGTVDLEQMDSRMRQMREFYYARMTNTAMLLVAASSTVVSLCALVASIVALKH